ncbi:hypothetical protein PUNSTDRAFT_41987 [Punctularia strigosozonata HHB-11173 SS5]|uniref:uncharacterized protein n=1 Tax=Punctularia strigosozonata (strain HHB-11173) TaxID=741275 RepID=UPI00044172D6|nr:uncharacterized protein PUNSTDRAFT_41987 [Punctularia strigosozonata HHB-11173 SS5]EIN12333.1 hypothetical protein PUNSTDRAFT_41987 [Punctularia strigosozonata HHB-11173 SS5]
MTIVNLSSLFLAQPEDHSTLQRWKFHQQMVNLKALIHLDPTQDAVKELLALDPAYIAHTNQYNSLPSSTMVPLAAKNLNLPDPALPNHEETMTIADAPETRTNKHLLNSINALLRLPEERHSTYYPEEAKCSVAITTQASTFTHASHITNKRWPLPGSTGVTQAAPTAVRGLGASTKIYGRHKMAFLAMSLSMPSTAKAECSEAAANGLSEDSNAVQAPTTGLPIWRKFTM